MAYAATIGFFDGVHLGHQFVLARLKEVAQANGLQAAVVTFTEHPQKVLQGASVALLTPYDERMALLKAQGVDQIFAFRFDVIHEMTAEVFMDVLKNRCDVHLLLMGYDHRFGSDQLSRFEDYLAAAARLGLQLQLLPVAPPLEGESERALSPSSTHIREALEEGRTADANRMLGYPYSLTGEVVEGRHIGRTIGFPTANLHLPADKLLPLSGVYAAEVDSISRQEGPLSSRPAILNVGCNPTVGGKQTTAEAHILDFNGDLYGDILRVRILRFIRPEHKFRSLDALKEQIAEDIEQVKINH